MRRLVIRSLLICACLAACMASAGCQRSPLEKFVFASNDLPRNVSLAPWDGSDKLPFMTKNPQMFSERDVIDTFGFDAQLASSITHVLIAVYWEKSGDKVGEIGVIAMQFKDKESAARAKGIVNGEQGGNPDEAALDQHATVLFSLSRTPDVSDGTWAAMRNLAQKALMRQPE